MPLARVGGWVVAWKREEERGGLRAELRDAGSIIRATGGGRPEVVVRRGRLLPGHRLVMVPKERPTPAAYPRPAGRPAPARASAPMGQSRLAPTLPRPARPALAGSRPGDVARRTLLRSRDHARRRALRHPPNTPALEAVLAAVGSVDQVWVLGDIVGYGPHPDAVVARLREPRARSPCRATMTRQSWAASPPAPSTTRLASPSSGRRARSLRPRARGWRPSPTPGSRATSRWSTAARASPLWEYLISTPWHGSTWRPSTTPHCLVGHTHLPLTFREDEWPGARCCPAGDGAQLHLDGRRCILNPGSVGQPRDGDPRACAMLLDTETREVDVAPRRVPRGGDAAGHPCAAAAGRAWPTGSWSGAESTRSVAAPPGSPRMRSARCTHAAGADAPMLLRCREPPDWPARARERLDDEHNERAAAPGPERPAARRPDRSPRPMTDEQPPSPPDEPPACADGRAAT